MKPLNFLRNTEILAFSRILRVAKDEKMASNKHQIVPDNFPEAKGVFLDFSEDMIQAAQIKMADMEDRIELIQYDYSQKDWVNKVTHCAPYDIVVSGLSIHHQPDQRKREIYREIYQLLSPAGLFLNVEHVASRSKWIESISEGNFIDALFAYEKGINTGRSREDIADEFHHRPEKEANILALVEDQCDWLREIGFQDVDCYFKLFEISVFGGRKPL